MTEQSILFLTSMLVTFVSTTYTNRESYSSSIGLNRKLQLAMALKEWIGIVIVDQGGIQVVDLAWTRWL